MTSKYSALAALALAALTACSDSNPEKTCADFCGAGNTCDAAGRCVQLACNPGCGPGTACQMGACVAVQAVTCAAANPGCAACDTTLATPAWVGQCGAGTACSAANDTCQPIACTPACGAGTACQNGACVPVAAVTCTDPNPGCSACIVNGQSASWQGLCGAGTTCNGTTSACEPTPCSPACGAGTACQNGACVPVEAVTCTAAYPGCSACIVSGQSASWQGLCGAGSTCNTVNDTCVSTSALHDSFGALTDGVPGPLRGPFTTGYQVTAACVGCHPVAAAQVMASQHWTWAGPTPDLVSSSDLTTVINPGTIGKSSLINNFCVATPSNDKRCDQCHAGYGGDPDLTKPQKSARAYTLADSSIPLESRIDCLVCHSNPTAAYAKDPKNFGNPVATVNLAVAARDIRMPTRSNCGACHFYAGGGDNVKLMGSSLKNPAEAIDVHMGRGMECLDCHAGPDHTFKGSGVHVPSHTARTSCADCHGAAPHEGKVQAGGENLDAHAQKIGCQTCHIPRFSKGQFGKMDWDWSTAGNNTRGTAGVVTTKVNDDGTPNTSSLNAVVTYDYIKGDFAWQKNVAPAYAWSNGKSTHALTSDKADFTAAGLTGADADRVSLGEPVGGPGNGKIMPFKLMKGRQAFYLDGANGFVITPNVFGPGSFWGVIQAVGYSFTTYDFDGAGPIAAGQPSVDALWGKILATGAVAAGQAPAGTTAFAKYDGVNPGYDWRYTKLYMDLNHEVAPKAQAIGANNACGDCHSGTGNKLPLCKLYGNAPPAGLWGVTCP